MSRKQRTASRLIAARRRSSVGLQQWLRQFGIADAHELTEQARTTSARIPHARREQLALALLARSLALLDKRSKYRPISWLGMADDDPLLKFDYLISCYEQRRTKHKKHRKQQPAGKPGRPRKYDQSFDTTLLALVRNGQADLRKKGATRISDKEALAAGIRALWTERGFSEHELRQLVGRLRRRIPEARKRMEVAPKTPR